MEQGKFEPTEEGSAQGSAMSPMLANIYMHHVLTLWFKLVVLIIVTVSLLDFLSQRLRKHFI